MSINTNIHIKHFRAPHCHNTAQNDAGVLTTVVQDKDGVLSIGWSFCDPRDLFSKKVGRENALSRFENDPVEVPIRYEKTQPEINLLVLCALHASGKLPHASKTLVSYMISKNAFDSM